MNTTEERPPTLAIKPPAQPALALVYSASEVVLPVTRHVVPRAALRIGREVEGGLLLAGDKRASRLHATVHSDVLGRLRIVDEGSRNGTTVNGVRVAERALEAGDVIGVGDSFLVVSREPPDEDVKIPELMGTAPVMRTLRAAIARVAPTDATVVLLGESGAGKEVVARAIHEQSGRRGPLVAVNCSAIPETLAESQLFGVVSGAFTGATARPGFFRAAHGGTLFLDEMGDLPPVIQPKLLRALEEHAVIPVGATQPLPCDVRIVAATNRDLDSAIARGQFRGDLLARLAQFPLPLPPLRDRREDILLLLAHALGHRRIQLGLALVEAMLVHPWPFNVRGVLALARQLRIRGGDGPYDLEMVQDTLRVPAARTPAAPAARVEVPTVPAVAEPADESAADRSPPPDRATLERLLAEHRGVVADVARVTGRSRKQVYRWITEHGIEVEKYRGE